MPTIDSDRQGPHHARQLAESFGVDPERYDRARPRYPDALLTRIVGASPGLDVLDVGCGTGIVARQLQALGCRVLGVEPDARMADFAQRTGVECEIAKFEDWDPAGRTFDTVISGQTWHWVDPFAGAAKASQVLRPGGLLTLAWNGPQFPPDLGEAISAFYREALPDQPFLHQAGSAEDAFAGFLGRAGDGIRQSGRFGEPTEWRTTWQRDFTKEEWLDGVPTAAGHDRFPPELLQRLLQSIGAAIDAVGGRFTMTFNTVALVAHRS